MTNETQNGEGEAYKKINRTVATIGVVMTLAGMIGTFGFIDGERCLYKVELSKAYQELRSERKSIVAKRYPLFRQIYEFVYDTEQVAEKEQLLKKILSDPQFSDKYRNAKLYLEKAQTDSDLKRLDNEAESLYAPSTQVFISRPWIPILSFVALGIGTVALIGSLNRKVSNQ